jgi:hypothetical protein
MFYLFLLKLKMGLIMCCVGSDRKEESNKLKSVVNSSFQIDVKPLVNMLPDVSSHKDKEAFSYL